MGVSVTEYLGIRTDGTHPIPPIPISKTRPGEKPTLPCPFKNSHCDKAKRGDKPICSVRDTASGKLWIVCSHRLCATSPKHSDLTPHQVTILHDVAKTVFDKDIKPYEVLVKREESIQVTDSSSYSADFVMWRRNPKQTSPFNPDRAMVLEMQGGGETTNTGHLTSHIDRWERAGVADNELLRKPVSATAPLVTNAWRRQQEQFLVKGNIAMLTGGRMAFCVGSMIYDYLIQRFRAGILSDLREANWTLALLTFQENPTGVPASNCPSHAIQLQIDPTRTLFTNYSTFVQVLTNQASASPSLFTGTYHDLTGGRETIK